MNQHKKPWNRVNLPVYSISSTDGNGNHNMHIITYATAISMQPKQFVCGIYNGTKTLSLVHRHKYFVLQLLAETQYKLVNVLGKKSGNNYNKIAYLEKRDLLTWWNGFYILKDALAVMHLAANPVDITATAQPDHQLFICDMLAYKNLHAGNALTLDVLRHHKIVRM